MNERSRLHAIEYRRLIASVAAHLSAEEVERIAFIRLSDVDNSPCITGEKTSALQTLAALERQGEFSLQNIDGLLGIVKDVNRHDLIELIENYKKARALARKSGKSKTHRPLRKHSNPSEGRRQLEETHEMMVTSFTFLEQQMSLIPRLLEGEGDIQDEGTVILHSLKHAAEELAGKLGQAHEYFLQHSRSRASSGSESPRGSFEDTTSENKRMNPDHLTRKSCSFWFRYIDTHKLTLCCFSFRIEICLSSWCMHAWYTLLYNAVYKSI